MLSNTITITAYNRPHYFEQLLFSLIQNNLDGWKIYIQVEPSHQAQQFIDITNKILQGKNYCIEVNKSVLGVRQNPFAVLKKAFESGSRINIYLEEDLLVSPDITRLADWYLNLDHTNLMCLNLMLAGCSSSGFISSVDHPECLFETKCFNSLGFIITDKQWQYYFAPNWFRFPQFFLNVYGDQVDGWDLAMYDYLLSNHDLKVLAPLFARANHNGQYGGAHCSEAFHEMAFGNLPIYQGQPNLFEYAIEKNINKLPHSIKAHLNLWQEMTQSFITLKRMTTSLKTLQQRIGWKYLKRIQKLLIQLRLM